MHKNMCFYAIAHVVAGAALGRCHQQTLHVQAANAQSSYIDLFPLRFQRKNLLHEVRL